MERNIHSPLVSQLVFFVLLIPSCSANSGLKISKVVHIPLQRNWTTAQNYCRMHYTDLVTIRNMWDNFSLSMFGGWIGLYNGSDGVWRWSRGDENANVTFQNFGKVNNSELCVFKNESDRTWESDQCSNLHPFLCMDERLILVQELKTWEEALQHCRELQPEGPTVEYAGLQYDLASLPEANNILLERIALTSITDEVWVGLRFLAGEWMWMSGEEVTSSYLPQCPAQQQHCGVLIFSDIKWQTLDCSEKRNFLCSIKLSVPGEN